MKIKSLSFFIALLFCCSQRSMSQDISLREETVDRSIPVDSLKIVLEEMYDKDQGIRRELMEAMKKDPQSMGSIIDKMNRTDSLNQVQTAALLQKYGWVERSKIGKKASDAVFYVVQHAPLKMMEKYFPLLQDLATRGEAENTNVAMMQDRILMYKNKKQLYGTQASNLVREGGITVIWPVEDPSRVNERRRSAGFNSTIEEYAESMGAPYDPNEKLPAVNPWERL